MPISLGSDALLSWYFGGGAAHTLGASSNFGAMMDRAALYRTGTEHRVRDEDITVRPCGSYRSRPSAWTPDEDNLSRLGKAARELRRVQLRDPFALEIISVLYSDEAARWARTPHGRTAALIRLTETGKALLRKARTKQRGPNLALTEAQLAENLVMGPTPDFNRSVLLAKAMKEAQQLEDYACSVWNGTDVEAPCAAAE